MKYTALKWGYVDKNSKNHKSVPYKISELSDGPRFITFLHICMFSFYALQNTKSKSSSLTSVSSSSILF